MKRVVLVIFILALLLADVNCRKRKKKKTEPPSSPATTGITYMTTSTTATGIVNCTRAHTEPPPPTTEAPIRKRKKKKTEPPSSPAITGTTYMTTSTTAAGIVTRAHTEPPIRRQRDMVPREVTPVAAELSSTRRGNVAGNAIDRDWATLSIAGPGSDGVTWLKVTLGDVYCIDKVVRYWYSYSSYSSSDSCSHDQCTCERNCYGILVSVYTEGSTTSGNTTSTAGCVWGDTVKVYHEDGDGIVVRELIITTLGGYKNIAAQGTATQMDTHNLGTTADKAIDGNTDGHWRRPLSNSISQTATAGPDAWWKLTFSTDYYIDNIVIYNRENAKMVIRIDGLEVYVGTNLVDTLVYVQNKNPYKIANIDHVSNLVTIRPSKNYPIQLAEVEVYGTPHIIGCVKENFDFRGADIGGYIPNVATLDDCISLCRENARCKAVTHEVAPSICYLISRNGLNSRNLIC